MFIYKYKLYNVYIYIYMLFTSGMRKESDSSTEHLSQEMEGCLEEMPCFLCEGNAVF